MTLEGYSQLFIFYISLIKSLEYNSYGLYNNPGTPLSPGLYIRHNVVYDVELALKLALSEFNNNICSNYFFKLRGIHYNMLSVENTNKIKQIKTMGHTVNLLFNKLDYKGEELTINTILTDCQIVEKYLSIQIGAVCLGEPNLPSALEDNKLLKIINLSSMYFLEKSYFVNEIELFKNVSNLPKIPYESKKILDIMVHPYYWIRVGENINKYNLNEFIQNTYYSKNNN